MHIISFYHRLSFYSFCALFILFFIYFPFSRFLSINHVLAFAGYRMSTEPHVAHLEIDPMVHWTIDWLLSLLAMVKISLPPPLKVQQPQRTKLTVTTWLETAKVCASI